MSQNNAITVKTYNDEYQIYLDKTVDEVKGSIKTFIDTFLGYIKKDSQILEIGSGAGRDASYIEKLGYEILRTDAAKNFVENMKKQGHEAQVLDIVNETLNKKFDAIFADAVFLHFDDAEFGKAINHVVDMLNPSGIFALSLHKGTFRGMSSHKHSSRYFHEWTEQELVPLLSQYGFAVLKVIPGESVSKRKEWIMPILKLAQPSKMA